MKKEKVICDFGRKDYNKIKRTGVEKAPRPGGGGSQHGKPSKGDTTPPGISSIVASNITDSTAVITFVTNEETISKVEYGGTISYGTTKNSTGSTSHTVSLVGLLPSVVYQFRVIATDLAGNITTSANQSFSTAADSVKVVYLDFYGETVSGTMWNVNGPIVASHSGLSETEVAAVLLRVQEHFSDYDVTITNDINLYNNAPYSLKTRVILTESHEWYGSSAGGVAYINSFGWGDQSPAWVFTTLLGYSVHNIGEAAAHEIGHTMGLRHQSTCVNGVKTSEYNWGDGVTAPTMGASYNVTAGDWWIGPNSLGCSVIQNDGLLLEAKLGLK